MIFAKLLRENATIRFFSSDNVARSAAAQSGGNFMDKAAFRFTMSVLRGLEIPSTETHLAPILSTLGSLINDVAS